jgi:hypothetical protein
MPVERVSGHLKRPQVKASVSETQPDDGDPLLFPLPQSGHFLSEILKVSLFLCGFS